MEAPSGINVTALALYDDKIYAGTDKVVSMKSTTGVKYGVCHSAYTMR